MNISKQKQEVRSKKQRLFFLCLFFSLFVVSRAMGDDIKTRVLFIGNSLTTANNLPQLIADLAKSRNHLMEYDVYAPGGYHFYQHAADQKVLDKINEGTWDYVVLQEQGQAPAFSEDEVREEVYPFARELSEAVKAANPQARVVFYMTMARKNGDPRNAGAVSQELETYEGMQNRINQSYLKMARNNSGLIAPVGLVWKEFRAQYPSVDLYTDEIHQNLIGTYLTACTFYTVFFDDISKDLPHPSSINRKTASIIQDVTDKIIKLSVVNWETMSQSPVVQSTTDKIVKSPKNEKTASPTLAKSTKWERSSPFTKLFTSIILIILIIISVAMIYLIMLYLGNGSLERVVTIIGVIQAAICLLAGVPNLLFGFWWFLIDIIAISFGGGGNLTGLGLIIGLPVAGSGIVLLFGFISALLLLKRNPEGRKCTVIVNGIIIFLLLLWPNLVLFSLSTFTLAPFYLLLLIGLSNLASLIYLTRPRIKVLFTVSATFTSKEIKIITLPAILIFACLIFYVVQQGISSKIRFDIELKRAEEEARSKKEKYRLMDVAIRKKFESQQIVTVRFDFHYGDDYEAERKAVYAANVKIRKELNKKFVMDNIIIPIGSADMPHFRSDDSSLSYIVEVTKAGYEKLRPNKYVKRIGLWEKK